MPDIHLPPELEALIGSPNFKLAAGISAVFAVYVLLIVIFAVVYYRKYLRRPGAFSFNQDISLGQIDNHVEEQTKLAAVDEEALAILVEGAEAIESRDDDECIELRWEVKFGDNNLVCATFDDRYSFISMLFPEMQLFKGSLPNERIVLSWGCRPLSGYTVKHLKRDMHREATTLMRRIQSSKDFIAGANRRSPIWGFADFFYFSVIIQSTVGLGDIQPNSTSIRKIVSFQILLGYLLLVVALNVFVAWQTTAPK